MRTTPARFIFRRIRARAHPRKCNRLGGRSVIKGRKLIRRSCYRRRATRLADPSSRTRLIHHPLSYGYSPRFRFRHLPHRHRPAYARSFCGTRSNHRHVPAEFPRSVRRSRDPRFIRRTHPAIRAVKRKTAPHRAVSVLRAARPPGAAAVPPCRR